MGLVNQVFDSHEALVEGVMSIAAEIASKAPLAVYGCKRMINYARDHTTQDGLDYVAIWNASHFQKEEIRRPCSLGLSVAPATLSNCPPFGVGKLRVNLPRLFAQRTNKDPVQLRSSIQRQTLRPDAR